MRRGAADSQRAPAGTFEVKNYAFEEGGARGERREAELRFAAGTTSAVTSPSANSGTLSVTAATAGASPTCANWQTRHELS